ncbi:efflux RND transporter permease subunit [Pseudoduganella lurida]|uniref:efflux RND transporter permease subunit n=1 Tax=Pseudoduganella lurida TaxID=1036180 RepID=UPI0011A12655|nr:CusA/CzcA family heavy metal efflux RND transporter [Pseudoduganella lurida]
MFDRLIRFAITQRLLVMLLVLGGVVAGTASYRLLPIDALPDITNVQVQINTAAPGLSPLEVEQRISQPLELAMAGLPKLEQTRSLSRYGLSQITVVFRDGTDLYFARQLVSERVQQARGALPPDTQPALGPPSSGLGEIYQWQVQADPAARKPDGTAYTTADLREIQDWIIRPQLRTVRGVADVNAIGGIVRAVLVAPDVQRLAAHGLTLRALTEALERNNGDTGAGYVERNGEQLLVRVPGRLRSADDVGNVVVAANDGVPLRVRDVATVGTGGELRTGAATVDGQEAVLGTALMLVGENSRTVASACAERLADINRSLPGGVQAVAMYDRTVLVNKAIGTVRNNLLEGAVLVIAVLLVFLGNVRAALITALVIPLAMLLTFTGMMTQHVSANLLSLGALDFGIIVDGAVVIVENCVRRLSHARAALGRPLTRQERHDEVFDAAREARRPLLYGQLIIIAVYLPLFALSGVEGRMFQPMAVTVVIALLAAMLLSVTFVPAAVALWIGDHAVEKENGAMRIARRWYAPLLERVLANAPVVITFAVVTVLVGGLAAVRMGSEFAPQLDEGDYSIQALRMPGTSLTQSVALQQQLETALLKRFPEIERVFARTGTAEIASDPMPPNVSDGYVMLKPRAEWPDPKRERDDLLAAIREAVEALPGQRYEFSQPVQLRFNELISGARGDVAVKVFGDDPDMMAAIAARIAARLQRVQGAAEVSVEQSAGLPVLNVGVDRDRAGRLGLNAADIQETVAIATGGKVAGSMFEGERRFDVLVRLPEGARSDLDALRRLPLALPGDKRAFVPLSEVATLSIEEGPNQLSRENGKRRVLVNVNVDGRDISSFVAEAQAALKKVPLPAGVWLGWGGQFEQLQAATARLAYVVPAALLLVLALLLAMFGTLKDGLLVFTGIPFALTGGIAALYLRGIPLSISAAVGFIALSGVAVLNGLVLVHAIRGLRDEGLGVDDAVRQGALLRLRPVLMTALVASLGFVPMALATGTGAEVQRPLATVVIGGILSSTALTLLVLPLLYRLTHR